MKNIFKKFKIEMDFGFTYLLRKKHPIFFDKINFNYYNTELGVELRRFQNIKEDNYLDIDTKTIKIV